MFNQTFTNEVSKNVKSRQTLVNLLSDNFDQERLERHLEAIASIVGRKLFIWNMTQGLSLEFCPEGKEAPTAEIDSVEEVLETIRDLVTPKKDGNGNSVIANTGSIYYLQDLALFLEGDHSNPMIIRQALSLGRLMKKSKSIIITSSTQILNGFVNIDVPLPTADEIASLIKKMVNALPIDTSNLTQEGIAKIATNLVGLNETEAKTVLSYVMVETKGLADSDAKTVAMSKAQKLSENEALELVNSDVSFDDVGGLKELKTWITRRKRGFSKEAQEFGLVAPKGVVLLGIPGMGKSLAAKAIANEMELPLIGFDIGAVFGGLVGQSEKQLREVLKVLETLTPFVLWIDEIDKAFSQGSDGDSGTSKRVLGKILTWIQETEGVFIIATGNNPQTIPTELLRKGRFDETFFIDLANDEVRKDIFKVHLDRVNRLGQFDDNDLNQLVQMSNGYVGSEIEAGINEALYIAFDSKEELHSDHVITALSEIVPMSQTHGDSIAQLRNWAAKGQCRLADKEAQVFETHNKEVTAKPENSFELDL